jgi:AAA domain
MAKPSAIVPGQRSKKKTVMIYGPPGAGKTRLIGTGGKGTLIIRPPVDHTDSIITPGFEEWEVSDWAEMNNVGEDLHHDGAKDYPDGWVWLDSVSLFQDIGLDDIWEGVIAAKPHRRQYGLDQGEYGVNMWRLQTWIRHVVGIPGFNFGIVAHPAELPNINGQVKFQPWIQGRQMSQKVQGYMNMVAYLEVVQQDGKEPRRVLRTRGTEDYEAKDQYDAFPNGRLVDPTMPKIVKAIDDAITARGGTQPKRRPTRTRTKTRRA